jgi:hypothetical protein
LVARGGRLVGELDRDRLERGRRRLDRADDRRPRRAVRAQVGEAGLGARTGDGGEQAASRLRVEQHRIERVRRRLLQVADRPAQPQVLRLQGREDPLGERLARALEQRHGGQAEPRIDA